MKTSIKIMCFLVLCSLAPSVAMAADVILDPGHSPGKPGAQSCTGHYEYLYNDALAKSTREYLAGQKLPVDLTRKPGQELSLMERARKSAGKRLFLSMHHDGVQPQFVRKVNGFPSTDYARGYSIFVSRKNPYFEKSLEYARVLGKALREQGLQPSTHHGEKIKGENRTLLDKELGVYAFDDLVVLKHAKSPAVLFEAGVILEPGDEQLVRTDNFRAAVAKGVEAMVRHH